MSGSGTDSKLIDFITPEGEHARTLILSSRDVVEIGECTFKRSELLFAMGVSLNEVRELESGRYCKEQVSDVEG